MQLRLDFTVINMTFAKSLSKGDGFKREAFLSRQLVGSIKNCLLELCSVIFRQQLAHDVSAQFHLPVTFNCYRLVHAVAAVLNKISFGSGFRIGFLFYIDFLIAVQGIYKMPDALLGAVQ